MRKLALHSSGSVNKVLFNLLTKLILIATSFRTFLILAMWQSASYNKVRVAIANDQSRLRLYELFYRAQLL